MIPSAGSELGNISAAGGYGPPGGGGYGGPPPGGGGYGGPPPGGGGFGGPPPGGGGYGPPGGPPPGGFGGPPGGPPGYGGPPPAYGGPPGFGGPPGGMGDRAAAEAKVKIPAIVMMVLAIIGAIFDLIQLIMHAVGSGMHAANGGEMEQIMNGAVGAVIEVIGLICTGFVVYGFIKMMKLQSRTLSYVAVIMSMVPCTGACCYINVFVGIWALMVLADPVVKAHHQ